LFVVGELYWVRFPYDEIGTRFPPVRDNPFRNQSEVGITLTIDTTHHLYTGALCLLKMKFTPTNPLTDLENTKLHKDLSSLWSSQHFFVEIGHPTHLNNF